jgi:serine/threonine-protein kinase
MGTVYQAVDLRLGRKVAVKIMAVSLFGDAAARRRFAREARACARLDHPNIVRIYDFGDIECGGAFLVLEYVPGANLRRELPNLRAKPAHTVQILSQVLNAVEAAHAAGIIHRDLKPENILLIGGQPVTIAKVADFGLAKIHDSEPGGPGNQISMERNFGTAGYMAPEQCYGQEIDARADLYSLGAITLELLGGTVPSSPALSHAQIHEAVGQLGTLGNAALRQVLHQSLALQPEERYQNVAAFRAALMPALENWASMVERLQQDTAISGQSFLANQPTLARRVGR